jgi:hypothetical protein
MWLSLVVVLVKKNKGRLVKNEIYIINTDTAKVNNYNQQVVNNIYHAAHTALG